MKKSTWKRISAILLSSVMILSNSSVMALAEDLAAEEALIEVVEELAEVEEKATEVIADQIVPAAEETVTEEQILGDNDEISFVGDAGLLDVYAAVKEQWGVEISSSGEGMQMFPGTTATLTAKGWHTFPNESGEETKEYPEMTYDWSVTNMDGTTKNCPVTITADGSNCEVTAKSTGKSYAVYVNCDGYWEGNLVAEGRFVLDVEHFEENFGVEIETSRGKSPMYAGSTATLTAKGWHEYLTSEGLPNREYPESMTYEWMVSNTDGTTENCPVTITVDGASCVVAASVTGSDYTVDIYCDGYWEGNLVTEGKYTLNVTHYSENWGVDLISDHAKVDVFAGEKVTLTAKVWHEALNANGDPEKTYPENITCDWEVVTDNSEEMPVTFTEDGMKCEVKTKWGTEAYTADVYCDVYQDNALLVEGKTEFDVYKLSHNLEVLNVEALAKLYPGDELVANAKLVSYLCNKAGERTEAEIDDLVTYSFEWEPSKVQITDTNGKVLSTEDKTGEAPFTLKRLRNGDTYVNMSADVAVEDEVHKAVSSKNWDIAGYDYADCYMEVKELIDAEGNPVNPLQGEELALSMVSPITYHKLDASTVKEVINVKYEVVFDDSIWTVKEGTEADEIPILVRQLTDETAISLQAKTENKDGVVAVIAERTYVFDDVTVASCEHVWDEGTVTTDATCTEAGEKLLTCIECGTQKTSVVAATGHKMGAWTVVSKATVWKAEQQKQTCKNGCGHSVTKAVGNKLIPTIKLTDSKITLKVKQSTTGFKVSGLANGDSIKSITLNKTKYVTLSNVNLAKGTMKLTAKKKADTKSTTKLIITLASGLKKEVAIKVQKGKVKTTGITGVGSKLTLAKGSKATLAPVKAPFTSKEKIKYSSSKKSVVKVTSKGVVTAVAPGTAKITVKSGKKKVTCTVTVPGIANVKGTATVKRKKSLTLKPKLYGINTKATFVSSDPAVATVSASGKVTGVKKGTATITVKAGNYTVKCKVKVK